MTSTASRRGKNRVASDRDYAKLDWKPWERTADMQPDELRPSGKAMHALGVTARYAYAVMLRSADDLIEMHKNVPAEAVDYMLDAFSRDEKRLREIADMIRAANIRCFAAMCKLKSSMIREARRKKPRLKIVSSKPAA
jgi:hypothetical protein